MGCYIDFKKGLVKLMVLNFSFRIFHELSEQSELFMENPAFWTNPEPLVLLIPCSGTITAHSSSQNTYYFLINFTKTYTKNVSRETFYYG